MIRTIVFNCFYKVVVPAISRSISALEIFHFNAVLTLLDFLIKAISFAVSCSGQCPAHLEVLLYNSLKLA